MTYLITQILLCLLAAFLLGLLLGWWLWSRGCDKKIEEAIAEWRAKFDRADKDWKAKLADIEAKLAAAKADAGPKVDADALAALKAELAAERKRADDADARIKVLMIQLDEYKVADNPDDLTRVEGIGPKIQELLFAAKIYTFGQLARTEASRLQEILDAAGERFQMHDPKTWPEQAQLAADGEWSKLEELQDLLRGGRED